jgi:hypothetical protein
MKAVIRVQVGLDVTVTSDQFPDGTDPLKMAAILRDQVADDPFFFADASAETTATVLSVDGVPVANGDWLPEVEEVAGIIHAAWMDEKLVAGIRSRKAEDGEELMVPYSQLSEKAKASNRILVRTVYAAIADAKDA